MAVNVIAIGGVPASGKSTLVKEVMRLLGPKIPGRLSSVLYTEHPEAKFIVLGWYPEGNTFGGTDRLTMNVQPEAERVLAYFNTQERWEGYTVLFEGDRLFNGKFFDFMNQVNIPYKIVLLEATDELVAQRHALRHDTQDEKWKAGRATKVKNVVDKHGCCRFAHLTGEDTHRIALLVRDGLPGKWPCPDY